MGRPRCKFGVGELVVKGEDHHFTWHRQGLGGAPSWEVFGICDGHGGAEAAGFIKRELVGLLGHGLPDWQPKSWSSPDVADFAFRVCEAVCSAIEVAERKWRSTGCTSGSTLTLAVICDRFVTMANIGDSHAFLSTGDNILEVTHSHRLQDNPYEVDRLRGSGALVAKLSMNPSEGPAMPGENGIGSLRVWPAGLSVGRAFGDIDAPLGVISRPHIKQMVIPEAGGRLTMASDGVWDILCPRFTCRISKHIDVSAAPRNIMDRVLLACGGHLQDDATILIVDFAPTQAHKDRGKPRQWFRKPTVSEQPPFFCELDSHDIHQDLLLNTGVGFCKKKWPMSQHRIHSSAASHEELIGIPKCASSAEDDTVSWDREDYTIDI